MKKHSEFNDSKYTRWYYAIIEKRVIKDKRRKAETHHILPRSLGGSADPENLVRLSGHDHAWCHWLLTKMTEGENRAKMIYAFNMMGVYGEHMSRDKSYAIVRAYEKNRLEWSKTHSEKMTGKEPWNKGRKLEGEELEEHRRRIKNRKKPDEETMKAANKSRSSKLTGRPQSEETNRKKSESMTGFVRGPMSDFEKKKRSVSCVGKKKKDGHGDNVAAAVTGNISINRDGKEKRIKEHQLQEFLDSGWSLGGRPRKKKV